MCGIIGYTGFREANTVLVNCLKRLEYRGYDSAGIATAANSTIQIQKDIGEINKLIKELPFNKMKGNVGIGHCLHPETLVCTTDGKLTKISELHNQKVLSVNFTDGTVENGRNQYLMKHKSPKYLFHLRTPFSEFSATGEHTVFVTEGEGIKEKKISELAGNELIAVPRRIPHTPGSSTLFHDVPVKRHYILDDEHRKKLKDAREKHGYTKVDVERKTGIKTHYLSRIENGQRVSIEETRLKKLESLYNQLNIKEHAELTYRNPVTFPLTPSKELLQIIGYFIGDGFFHSNRCIRFKDERKEILEKYSALFENVFHVQGCIRKRKGHFVLDINSKYLVDWCQLNIPKLFKKTGEEEVPDFVFTAPLEHIACFLRGLFDAEGFVGWQSRQVCISMTNESVIKQIQFLLIKFGILSTFSYQKRQPGWNTAYKLQIHDKKSLQMFTQHIGFTSAEKQHKVHELLKKSKNFNYRYSSFPYTLKYLYHHLLKHTDISFHGINNSYCTDARLEEIIQKMGTKYHHIKKFIRQHLYSDIIWARFTIKKIVSNSDYVYDIEVDNNHNFIGNLVVQHNSRWATHGGVTKINAHPHTDCKKNLAIIHNGIIENFKHLKQELQNKGHSFITQTDTEVIAHLIEDNYKGNLEQAVWDSLDKIQGSYAIVAIHKDEPEKLVGARNESPLVIGVGDNENFIASDIPAFLPYTNRAMYLDDGETCVVTKNSITIYNKKRKKVTKEEQVIHWDVCDAEKAGFPHFMLKEIFDHTTSINQTLRARISEIDQSITFPENVEKLLSTPLHSIHIVACGTSYYAGLVGKYLIEELSSIPVIVDLASEYRYFGLKKDTSLVVAITQSGETADTLAALRSAKNEGIPTLAITNVIGSTATRIADAYLLMQSGPEIGVAATKTFTSQLLVLFLLALKLGDHNNTLGPDDLYKHILHLKALPRYARQVLETSNDIRKIAEKIKDNKTVFFIGRGINFPLAMEGALKLKEISYIHAEGFAAGELKHGPFALLTKDTPVVAIATRDKTYDKMLANIGEVKARGPKVIAVADEKDTEIEKHADYFLRFPTHSQRLSCVTIAILLQLFAYHVADLRNCPIDKPRNLAKSVTVE